MTWAEPQAAREFTRRWLSNIWKTFKAVSSLSVFAELFSHYIPFSPGCHAVSTNILGVLNDCGFHRLRPPNWIRRGLYLFHWATKLPARKCGLVKCFLHFMNIFQKICEEAQKRNPCSPLLLGLQRFRTNIFRPALTIYQQKNYVSLLKRMVSTPFVYLHFFRRLTFVCPLL